MGLLRSISTFSVRKSTNFQSDPTGTNVSNTNTSKGSPSSPVNINPRAKSSATVFGGKASNNAGNLARSNIRQGFLYKKPLKAQKKKSVKYALKGWKKRWFVLKKTCLYYFENEYETSPLGCISLDDVNVSVHEDDSEKIAKYQFVLITPYASHLMASDDSKERDAWVECVVSICGAYKLNKQVEYLTKLQVRVVEAKVSDVRNADLSEVYVSVKTTFQEFKTIKQYKTDSPIWNETFLFDLPRLPCELYVYLHYEEHEEIIGMVFDDPKKKKKKKTKKKEIESENHEDSVGAEKNVVTARQEIGFMRMSILEPEVQIRETNFSASIDNVSGSPQSKNKKNYHASTGNDFDLQTKGWFPVQKETKGSSTKKTFCVLTDDTDSSNSAKTKTIGEIYLEIEYIFEDLEGYPISFGTYLEKQKEMKEQENMTPEEILLEQRVARRKMVNRRYAHELKRVKTERNAELQNRFEMEQKNKLQTLRETYKEEEEKFKQAVEKMKKSELEEKEKLEQRLKSEEKKMLTSLETKLQKEEEERIKMINEKTRQQKLRDEQLRIETLLKIQEERNQKLKELEQVEKEKLRQIEERIEAEERKLRQDIEARMKREEDERLRMLEAKLKEEEDQKIKRLKRDIAKLEKESKNKKEYLEMQELRKKQMDQELKQEEKQRLANLQAQIREEELQMLKKLEEKLKQEEMQRMKELEGELKEFENKQKTEYYNRLEEEKKKLESKFNAQREQIRNQIYSETDNTIDNHLRAPDPVKFNSKAPAPAPPPPPPPPTLSKTPMNENKKSIPLKTVSSNPFDEITNVKGRLRKVEKAKKKSRLSIITPNPSSSGSSGLLQALMKRRKATADSDSEGSDDGSDIEDDSDSANPILSIIAKRIGKLQKQEGFDKEEKEWKELIGDNDEDDW